MTGRHPTDTLRESPVSITGLGPLALDLTGSIVEIVDRTMDLRVSRDIPAGTLVRIEAADTLWLGEVALCQPENGNFRVRVALAHALYGLAEIAHLAERFVANPSPPARKASETEPAFRN